MLSNTKTEYWEYQNYIGLLKKIQYNGCTLEMNLIFFDSQVCISCDTLYIES